MARTMRRIVLIAILLIALAGAACFALYNCSAGTPFEGVRTSALNMIIDQSGMKEKVKSELNQKANSLAERYGLPAELANFGVDMLEIEKWKVVDTPNENTAKNTVEFDVKGSPVQVTFYEDPSVISVKSEGKINTYGQKVSFEIPASAQAVVSVFPYANAAEGIDEASIAEGLSNLLGNSL